MWDITKTQYNRPNYLKVSTTEVRHGYQSLTPRQWNLIIYIMYIAAMGTVKISILLLYIRLFMRNRVTKYSTYACLTFVGGYIVACELSLAFGCQPLSRLFNKDIPGKCVDFKQHVLIQNCLNIVSDAFMVLIPIPAAWALQLPTRQKIGVIAIFATASVYVLSLASWDRKRN